MKNLYFYAGCVPEEYGLAGGDRIFIELAKRWEKFPNTKINLITSSGGKKMCSDYAIEKSKYVFFTKQKIKLASLQMFIKHFFPGLFFSLRYKLPENSIIYSTSNFITDAIPSFILKLRHRKKNVRWIGGYFLAPPNPFYGYDESKSKVKFQGFSALLFYLQDKISKYFINKYADWVYVTSGPDGEKFINSKRKREKIVVIKGGIDLASSNSIKNKKKTPGVGAFVDKSTVGFQYK